MAASAWCLSPLAVSPQSLPDGLLAHLEADLRQYDFTTLEARVRDALAADAASDDDDDLAFKGVIT